MKVTGVCPTCGRAASSKGRSECLYCGSPLDPVATGTVSAPSSGVPIAPPRPAGEPAAEPGAPATPRRATISTPKLVPNLYAEREKKMQAEEATPIADFVSSPIGKFTIWLGSIVLVVGGLVAFINKYTHGKTGAELVTPPPAADSRPDPKLQQAASQAQTATFRADAESAIAAVADAIERSGTAAGHYPDFVSSGLVGLEAGRDFAKELDYFAGGRISSYRMTTDPMTGHETFTVEAVSRQSGETLRRTGTLKVKKGFSTEPAGASTSSGWSPASR